MEYLLVNKIRCPDGVEIESRHRHDFVEHTTEDGRYYAVDGGLSYKRHLITDQEYTDLSCNWDTPHIQTREHFTWKRYLDKDENP